MGGCRSKPGLEDKKEMLKENMNQIVSIKDMQFTKDPRIQYKTTYFTETYEFKDLIGAGAFGEVRQC